VRRFSSGCSCPDAWNGKFLMGGGGGFVGSIDNQAQRTLDAGYATVGTDTGHQGDGTDASWALDNVERQVNFGSPRCVTGPQKCQGDRPRILRERLPRVTISSVAPTAAARR
jgi:hypothetical protein